MKEDIVLTEPGAPHRFAFVLDAPGLRAELQDDGSITLSRGGEVRFTLPAPFMVDSADELDGDGARSNAVSYRLIEIARVKVLIIEAEQAWLDDPARVYPVYLDPTTTDPAYTANRDTFISSGYPSYVLDEQWNPNEGGYYELWNGRYDAQSGNNIAFVRTGIRSDVTVTDAEFQIYVQHSYNGADPTGIQLARLKDLFTESQTWNMTQPDYVFADADQVADNEWAVFDVTNEVQLWAEGQATNHGFRIYQASTAQYLWKRLRARENATKVPKLIITWTVPTATASAPIGGQWHNTGVLDWTYSGGGSGFGQTKYQVQVSSSSSNWSSSLKQDSGVVSSSDTQWTSPTGNLNPGNTYYWRVKVYDGHTWSTWSDVASFKWDDALPAYAPPDPPAEIVAGAVTAEDPTYYDLGDGSFTVTIRGTDAHSGIERTYLSLYSPDLDDLIVYHDWVEGGSNCHVQNASTLVTATTCAETEDSAGTRAVTFTITGAGSDATFEVRWAFLDLAGNRQPGSSYTGIGKYLIFDATPPAGAITSPAEGAAISGMAALVGTADDANFKEYQLHYESASVPGVWNPIGSNPYGTPVANGTLGTWDAATLADGVYTLRLRVLDKARVTSGFMEFNRVVIVDNDGQVTWSSPSMQVTVQQGSSVIEDMTIIAESDVTEGSLAFDPTIDGLITPAAAPPFDIIAGVPYQVPMIFDVSSTTTVGTYSGSVSILSTTERALGSVNVTIEVVAAPAGVVPNTVSAPSRDRIVTSSGGNLIIGDELLVALEFETTDPESRILSLANAHGATILGSVSEALLYQLQFPEVTSPADLEAIRQALMSEPDVAFASVDHVTQPLATTPNDPEWHDWNESNPEGNNWNMELIHAPSAWDISTGDRSVPVAIIDADINTEHEDLAANVDAHVGLQVPEPGKDAHGTHVAGIACAAGNNATGVSGVAWACSLRAYEFAFATISAPEDVPTFEVFGSEINKVKRMVEAAQNGARIVNMSWGDDFGTCTLPSDPQRQAELAQSLDLLGRGIESAIEYGLDVLWVAAAGNIPGCDASSFSPAGLSLRFPANFITVASVNSDGALSSFSTAGGGVSVAAPGGDAGIIPETVFSTKWDDATCHFLIFFDCVPYGGYTGTSQAAPHVTGLAALVLSEHPGYTAADVRTCIVASAASDGLAVSGQPFHIIDAPSAVRCEGNLVLGAACASAKATGQESGWPRTNACDGSDATHWSGLPGQGNVANSWWAADLGSIQTASGYRIYTYNPDEPGFALNVATEVRIYGTDSDSAWAALVNGSGKLTSDPALNGWSLVATQTNALTEPMDSGRVGFTPAAHRYWLFKAISGGSSEWDVNEFEILGPLADG